MGTHHTHALFHCMMQVPECTRKASQVMTACNMPEKAEPKEQLAAGEAVNATTAGLQSTEDKETKRKTEEEAEGKNAEAPEKCSEHFINDIKEEEQVAETEEKADDVATAGVKKIIEDDSEDTEEESKSQGEP